MINRALLSVQTGKSLLLTAGSVGSNGCSGISMRRCCLSDKSSLVGIFSYVNTAAGRGETSFDASHCLARRSTFAAACVRNCLEGIGAVILAGMASWVLPLSIRPLFDF